MAHPHHCLLGCCDNWNGIQSDLARPGYLPCSTRALRGHVDSSRYLWQGGFFPGCVYLISCWYQRYEVQTRLAFFVIASYTASAFSVDLQTIKLIVGNPWLRAHADSRF